VSTYELKLVFEADMLEVRHLLDCIIRIGISFWV